MSYFRRLDAEFEQQPESTDEAAPRSPFSEVAGRFANWITGIDRVPPEMRQDTGDEPEPARDPMRELTPSAEPEQPSRFPLAPFGYNRAAVDEHLIGLEREIAELRADRKPPPSITEELERIGEQTASILVVAHDQANETTRRAQEQAERCVADAAANAVAITAEAKERLRELDSETDSVWRERERLLEDVRVVSAALATLADEASERFPAAEQAPSAGMFPVAPGPRNRHAGPLAFGAGETESLPMASEPQPTEAFTAPYESDGESYSAEPAQPGDTGSWLAGLEPPDSGPDEP